MQWSDADSLVYRINLNTGAGTLIGPSGVNHLNSLALGPDGGLYSVGVRSPENSDGRTLVRIGPATGRATPVRPLQFGSVQVDVRALAFALDGTLFAVNEGTAGGSGTSSCTG